MILDRFKVPKTDEVRVPEAALRQTVTAIFEKVGVARRMLLRAPTCSS